MASIIEILHHLAAFILVAALFVEFIQTGEKLTVKSARNLQLADFIFGTSFGVVLVVGLIRVFYFEKGASYYFLSVPFLTKMSLFVIVALLSLYPKLEFLSWTKSLKQDQAPTVTGRKLRTIRSILGLELIGVFMMGLCAKLMAYGIGFRG